MYRNNSNGRRAAPARAFMALCATLLAYGVLGAVATVPSTAVHAQSFSGLGFLPGGTSSRAQGVNADGTVVVGFGGGEGKGSIGPEAFRWTQAGGMAGLGFLPGGIDSFAQGVNADGTVVVGIGDATGTGGVEEAFRWTQAGGMAGLGFLTGDFNSEAQGVNADGTVVVGISCCSHSASGEAFRWTQAGAAWRALAF
jgi:probable HAF family extracellular repeat protein